MGASGEHQALCSPNTGREEEAVPTPQAGGHRLPAPPFWLSEFLIQESQDLSIPRDHQGHLS